MPDPVKWHFYLLARIGLLKLSVIARVIIRHVSYFSPACSTSERGGAGNRKQAALRLQL
jgi:hypothetical protein